MRTIPVVLAAVLLTGCAGRVREPSYLATPAPVTAVQVMDCARLQLHDLGYQLVPPGMADGQFRGERLDRAVWFLRALGWRDAVDQLTIVVESGRPAELRVVAQTQVLLGEDRRLGETSKGARQDAQQIIDACSPK